MKINGSVALVTGANRGLGEHFVRELLAAGAAKVYAASRDPKKVAVPGAVPIALDLTDPASVRAAAEQAQDVDLLINNAGISTGSGVLDGDLASYRLELETNVLGPLDLSRAFAPVLARNGGGAVVNVLSVLAWYAIPQDGAYGAAKAAQWSLTNSLRLALAGQGTQVTSVHVGYLATEMFADAAGPKADPAAIARIVLDGVAAGRHEVLADELSQQVKSALALDPAALYPQLAAN